MICENGCFFCILGKRLQKFMKCPTRMTARSIRLYKHTTPRLANCDHGCQMLFTTYWQMRQISLPNGPEKAYTLRHAFFRQSKQLQRYDSVHLSSVYTDYSFYRASYPSAVLGVVILSVRLSVRPSVCHTHAL